ncbi:MAG: TerC family protein [Candidatus Omnitrophica bacterium]|nr:TerC family protein [Candidatus Omnitrophota bacterium]
MLENWGWWVGFNVFVLAMLALDLGVFHRKPHEIRVREALIWSGVWITLAMIFNLVVYFSRGQEAALQFLTGYVIEKTLSVDNIFVFLIIFTCFRVPAIHQHKILFWGILGALVMRAIFIALGISLIEKFHWMIYVFGVVLVVTGIRIGMEKDKEIHPENNPLLKLFRRFVPVTETTDGAKFFTRKTGKLMATPLFVTLIIIETTDVIFAVDSIPAILAISSDPFIVYTSNVFAILGLRSLYFAISGVMTLFHHLHYGLAAILIFVGCKMILSDVYHISITGSLAFITAAVVTSIAASKIWPKKLECEVPSLKKL